MRKMAKRITGAAVLGGSLLFTGGLGIAGAAPAADINDGLVNLGVGTNPTVLRDVNTDVAAQVASVLCGTGNSSDITTQAGQVDSGTMPTSSCNSTQGLVTISQNGLANSQTPANAPMSSPNTATTPGMQSSTTPGTQSGMPAEAATPNAPATGLTPTS